MKSFKTILAFILLYAISYHLYSQKIPSEIILINETANGFLIDFNLPSYQVIDTNIFLAYEIDQIYNYIFVNNDSFGTTWDIGFPYLPQLTLNLPIPDGSTNISVESLSIVFDTITINHHLLPAQDYEKDTIEFLIDSLFYNSDGSTYSFVALLSDPFIVMGKHGISLAIFPFQYNPLHNTISVINSATFSISYSPPEIIYDPELSEIKEEFLDAFFHYYTRSEVKSMTLPSYLIITPPRFENTLTYFANYKRNIGFDVTVTNTNTTGNTTGQIKNYIKNYDPDFVLLVGDVGDIPTYGTLDGTDKWDPTTDLNYARLYGSDYFPDVFLGRLSVSTTDELQNILNKTIFMESNLHNFEKRAKFLAGLHLKDNGEPNSWWCKKFEEGHNWAIDNSFIPLGYDCEKVYAYTFNHGRNDALDALDDNPIYYVFSGHGNHHRLGNPFFITSSDINSDFRTHSTYPLGFSFACKTCNFGINECYGESWIRSEQGGVSYFGCSVNSLVVPDVKLEKSLFFFANIGFLGPMVDLGKISFWVNYWTIFNNKRWKRYMKSYNLLGDPALQIFGIGCFQDLVFNNNEIFNNGDSITYHSADRIIAAEGDYTFFISSGANVKLKAAQYIDLYPGFDAEIGSEFLAYIEPCEDNSIKTYSTDSLEATHSNTGIQYNLKVLDNKIMITAYPNPFTNSIDIDYVLLDDHGVIIEIIDILGRKIYSASVKAKKGVNSFRYNGASLSSGYYLLILRTEQSYNVIKTIKIDE